MAYVESTPITLENLVKRAVEGWRKNGGKVILTGVSTDGAVVS